MPLALLLDFYFYLFTFVFLLEIPARVAEPETIAETIVLNTKVAPAPRWKNKKVSEELLKLRFWKE